MEPSSHFSEHIALIQENQSLRRRCQAKRDVEHLSLRLASQNCELSPGQIFAQARHDVAPLILRLASQNCEWSTAAMLVKAGLFWFDESPEEVGCVVCGAVPVTEWTLLSIDPRKAGLHCAAHAAAFHSVCAPTYNCCEQYDPSRDYEWRPQRFSQESQRFSQESPPDSQE